MIQKEISPGSRLRRAANMGGYRGGYLIGFIIISAVAVRTTIFYQGEVGLALVISLLAMYSLLYILEPRLSSHFRWYKFFYFPLQTVVVIVLTNLRPFTDVSSLLYVPLCIQAIRAYPHRAAMIWLICYITLLTMTLALGLGWLAGSALALLFLAVCAFLISYDYLYSRTEADQVESQRLLTDLQAAHQRLQEFAVQAEELAAARERNRLAHELHDSVGQAIFGIILISQSARLLLDKESDQVPEQIDHLQKMTEDTLSQLRSMIAQLRPST
jgi:signal transduction histidine kinase